MKADFAMSETRSFKDRLWTLAESRPDAVRALVHAGVPAGVAPILAGRGFSPDEARRHVHCDLDAEARAGDGLRDMDTACRRIARAIRADERVTVFGDYDVDGATATALMLRALRHWGVSCDHYIPDRLSEGYGPNVQAMDTIEARGSDLVVFVDCGIAGHDAVDRARELGLSSVIVDHHAPQGAVPDADACVNPSRADDDSGLAHLCAAGLVWLVIRRLNACLGELAPAAEPVDLRPLLDIVALGTVADVVPLTGMNRAFVAEGLQVLESTRWPGLTALIEAAGASRPFTAYHHGFVLGPRINAGGRIGACDTGARLLATDNPGEARMLAQQLDAWNRERQEMEQTCKAEALSGLEIPERAGGAVFAVGTDWHEGVIGIVASRLKDAHDLPSFVLTRTPDGLLKGSARSMPGFDLGAAVIAAREQGLLIKGGGHPMAAGLSLDPENLPAFKAFIDARIQDSAFARTGAVTALDAAITPADATRRFANAMEALAPFGVGNPRPRVLLQGGSLRALHRLKDRRTGEDMHLKIEYAAPDGRRIKAMAFKAIGTPLERGLSRAYADGTPVELAGTLRLNDFRGVVSVELELDDARHADAAEIAPAA